MAKQLLLDALQGKTTERTPWLPFVGCHGAHLLDVPADEYLRSGELIVQGIREAITRYRPDGIPVVFDLQLEAEALGCRLQWSHDAPPCVAEHVLSHSTLQELTLPDERSGRIPEVLNAIRQLKAENHDVALYGLLTGPFTLALHLKGTNIFMEMYDAPDEAHELLRFCTDVAQNMARMYIEAGCDVIASVDPMTSQISPRAFHTFVSPYASELFREIRRQGAFSSFFVCGHAQKNVEVMCQCQPDNVSVDENIPLDFVKEVSRRYHISFGGNLQLTVVLLMGNEDDVRRHTLDAMELGGDTGYILAPGCDLPFHVPPENLQVVAEVIHEPKRRESISSSFVAERDDACVSLTHSEPVQTAKVLVEVITLDSEAFASSQYVVEVVQDVAEYFGETVVWREHKMADRDMSEFMLDLMVRNAPMICIDKTIKFVGTIPPRQELIQTIRKHIRAREKVLRHDHNEQAPE